MSPVTTMGELVESFTSYIHEIELDKLIIKCAKGEQPITTDAEVKYERTRKNVIRTLDIMANTKDPKSQKAVRSMRERFEKDYPSYFARDENEVQDT